MSTRSGRRYKCTMDGEKETSHWTTETTQRVVEVGLTEGKMGGDARAAGQQPALGEMMTIFQLLKEMECQRERAAAEEHARQREELERRELVAARELHRREREAEEERRLQATQHAESLRLMQRQVETLTGLVELGRAGLSERVEEPSRRCGGAERIKLARLTEGDDIEAYLTTFEHLMQVDEAEEATWALRLAPQLTGNAQRAYAAMRDSDALDYGKVKAAILKRYNISEETYRQRFRVARRKDRESYSELVVRLEDLGHKWMAGCTTLEEVMEKVLMEQLLTTMPNDLRIWVAERKPCTGAEASQLADDYIQAPRMGSGGGGMEKRMETRVCHKCGQEGHLACNCPRKDRSGNPTASGGPPKTSKFPERPPVKCYNCGKRGHISMNCPEKAGYCGTDGSRKPVTRKGLVEGVVVSDILLDTGCTQTMVRRDLVSSSKIIEGKQPLSSVCTGTMSCTRLQTLQSRWRDWS